MMKLAEIKTDRLSPLVTFILTVMVWALQMKHGGWIQLPSHTEIFKMQKEI